VVNRTPVKFPNPLGPPTQTINYSHVSKLAVHGGAGHDFYGGIGTSFGTNTALYGSGTGNEFIVNNAFNSLDDIRGSLAIHGGGLDYLSVVDSGNTVGHTYTMTTGQLTRDGIAPITYDGIGQFILTSAANTAGQTSSMINVQSVNAVFAVLAVAKGDTITVGQNGSLAGIQAEMRIQANPGQMPKQITFDDSADTATHTITLKGNDPTFGYLVSGLLPNNDRIGFLSLDPTTPVSILGGPADKTFQVHDFVGAPAISLVAEPASSTRANMHNKLDYSAYAGQVLVSLPLGYATGFAKVSGIGDVTGSVGNNLLVGDSHPNILTGGTGRNVLIAGGGGDTLDAHLSQGDNLLIGGRTDWDTNLAALQAIMNEWDRTDLSPTNSFVTRLSDLTSGTGTTNPLNVVNGQLILLTPATNPSSNNGTVHLDGTPDTLIGTNLIDPATGKRARNWFFYDQALDTLVNYQNGTDRKTKI
jgi:hypothetical protein